MTTDNREPAAPPRCLSSKAWKIGILLLVIVGLTAAGYWMFFRPKPAAPVPSEGLTASTFPPDPRLAYRGPFRNMHPDVKYVGDHMCVDCHQDIARTYSQHPMGRSLVPIAQLADRQRYTKACNNPFEAFGILFQVDRQGARVYHKQTRLDSAGEPTYDFAHEVDHVIGSGARGHSYLLIRDGFVFQTPVSWFTQKQVWDLSPGFPPWARAGRLVQGACLYCHANRVEPVENTRNRYHEPVFRGHAIGCERCHGPGERHVRSVAKDDIVNPRRLEPALREAVCQQCHLQGATRVLRRGRGLNDYRPGMPLEEFVTVFVRAVGKGNKAVNHVEQMVQSLCFQRSSAPNKLGCITCHNPHETVAPDRRVVTYRQRCLACHEKHGCSLPEAMRRKKEPQDSCIACHMPRSATADIVHTASTDHRIIRKAGEEPANWQGNGALPNVPLLDFHRGAPDLDDREQARDLGVALYQLTLSGVSLTAEDGRFAVGLLNNALEECPDDLDAWEAKGKILQIVGRPDEAVEALETLLQRAPRHEGALVTLGTIHRDLGRTDVALKYWRRAVTVNPWVAEYQKNLVFHLADRNAWEELRPHCRKWLELDPASVDARRIWVASLVKKGRKTEAEAEYRKIRALRPPNLDQLDGWFAELMR
jgi:Flp pilus assembly protein TadD